MDFDTYQTEARKTRTIPPENPVVYSALGLTGEAGELANKVKKIMRGDSNPQELVDGIRGEMGDVLWYLAALADDLGITLDDVADENIKKLRSRYDRGTLKGAGDNR
ncbi:MAG: nucleoside triphosphate pyrophosphohydrolase family protein [Micavibrio sp.]|nr:nucleoside triphosphate pyrophosphohydrolase family protein [Micavibrio sp.]